jgi:hypothetical protein
MRGEALMRSDWLFASNVGGDRRRRAFADRDPSRLAEAANWQMRWS